MKKFIINSLRRKSIYMKIFYSYVKAKKARFGPDHD